MNVPFGGFFLALLLPVVAIGLSLWAVNLARSRRAAADPAERLAALEEQVRGLLYRVWRLEQGAAPVEAREAQAVPSPAAPKLDAVPGGPGLLSEPVSSPPEPAAARSSPFAPPSRTVETAAGVPSPRPAGGKATLDLEQRIGARWTTWVGVVVILFAVSFFLKWAFDNDYLGPRARVGLGLAAGLAMLGAGLVQERRRDTPYLSEGLAGGGLGVLYLSLFAAHTLYGLLDASGAFACMGVVTLLGAVVSATTGRQITAVLAVIGGLLTPVLLAVEHPDERNLLAYLLVLDALVLAIARFRTWPALNRLTWAGTALLLLPTLLREPEAAHPLVRLLLLSALFLLFLTVPIFRERAERRRSDGIDLALVVANAAAYFWAVYLTLEPWHPAAEGPYALALAILYRLVSADYASRVREDHPTVMIFEGVSWTFLSIAIPLALDGRWVTLAWAVQGVALLWAASRAPTPVAAWGGLVALLLAALRVVALDRYWYPDTVAVWNLTFLVHLVVVALLAVGGALAGRARPEGLRGLSREALRSVSWLVATLTLAVLFWREPPGLWPASLLTIELVAVGWLSRISSSPGFVIAAPLLAFMVLGRVLGADDALARRAAESLVSLPLLSRVGACIALAVAGAWLARSTASAHAPLIGRALAGAGGLAMLFALSANWTRYQDVARQAARQARRFDAVREIQWRTQVGLSVLWTLYAAGALAWGFLRSSPLVRYAALALFGLTVFKVFLVDLAAVKTAYRILSFLVLGVVLLLVGLLYQKARQPPAEQERQPPLV